MIVPGEPRNEFGDSLKALAVNLKQIQAFRAVMITGTTLGAGNLLHLSQPAISRLIGSLEASAGYELFERKQGRLRPTRRAELLLVEVERAFASLDRVATVLGSQAGEETTPLRVVATTPLAIGLVPLAMTALQARFPDVTASIEVVVRRELRAHLDEQRFDIALSTYPAEYPQDATEPLADAHAVAILPKGHRLSNREGLTPGDLADEHFVSMPPETLARQNTDLAFQQAGAARRRMSEAQNGPTICRLVASGFGVSVVDPFSASAFASDLARVPFRPSFVYPFRSLFPIRRPRTPHSVALAEAARRVATALLSKELATKTS